MALYSSTEEARQSGFYNGKWVGLPIYVKYKLLFSNKMYLTKYEKDVPKTWDELIETAEYILKREREENNNYELIGYSAVMPENDIAMCSIYEYLYSFRETRDSPMPEFNSQRAVEALEKFNKIKNATSSNEIMTSGEMYSIMALMTNQVVFLSFFDMVGSDDGYFVTEMPGEIEGIHGSCLTGLNIGVAQHISEEKKEASIEVVKYFISPETQKEIFVKLFKCYTTVKSLYDDEEVCSILNCDLAREVQCISRPGSLVENYDAYSFKVVSFFHEYIFNKRPIKDILTDIDNLTRIHIFSIKYSSDRVFFVVLLVFFYIVLLSPMILFVPKVRSHFQFLTIDGWILYTFGFLLMITTEFLNFGELNLIKCNLNPILFSLSFTFIYTPIIQRLISNIPLVSKFSMWVSKHKIMFYGIIILVEALYNLLYFIQPYKLKVEIMENNNNHCVCELKDTFGIVINSIQVFMIASFYLSIILLIFLEWNMENTHSSIRNLSFTMATCAPCIILLIILKFIDLKNFKITYIIQIIATIVFVLTNHVYVFFIRHLVNKLFKSQTPENDSKALFTKLNKRESNGVYVMKSSMLASNHTHISRTSGMTSSVISSTKTTYTITNKFLICHYARAFIQNIEQLEQNA